MRNRTHTLEEESFFPSITDLMVGIIFIFIIIVMALILQIKDEQQVIPKPLFDKISNLTEQEKTELDILIDEREDIDQRVKDLANEKIKNNKLNQQILEANKIIENQNEKIAILNKKQKKIDKIFDDLGLEVLKNEELSNQLIDANKTIENQSKVIDEKLVVELKNEKLIEELDLIKNDLNNKNKELIKLDKKIKDLNNQIIEIPILEEKIEILNKEIESYLEINNTNQNITDQLKSLLVENNKLEKENKLLVSEIQNSSDLINTKNKLEEQNLILENKIYNLQQEVNILQNENLNQISETEFIIEQINKLKDDATKNLLDEIKILFKKQNINITIDYPNSKFILSSNKLFSQGSSTLLTSGIEEINKISNIFAQILPCFSYEPFYLKKSNALNNSEKTWKKLQDKYNHQTYCNSEKMKISNIFKINTLMIEGHTDQDNKKVADEEELSVKRASNTFKQIRKKQILISGLTNKNGEPIFGYSGYGRTRPLIENAKTENQKSKNRRLEFRFLFGEPEKTQFMKYLKELQNAS